MNIDELPLLSIELFENHSEAPIVTRAEIEFKESELRYRGSTELIYVAGLFSLPEFPDQKYLICSKRVRRQRDGTATFYVDFKGFLLNEYPLLSSIARLTSFEILGAPIVTSPHRERIDLTKDLP